jgi:hypothetical protein
VKRTVPAPSRCGAPCCRLVQRGRACGVADRDGKRLGGRGASRGRRACYQTMRVCANCVLLCTTRESARLWEQSGLFNLRLSSDAPNLQVENEETIEALSARTKALLDRIQQRFLFARSLCAFIDRRPVDRPSHPSLAFLFRSRSFFFFSRGASARPGRTRSATIRRPVSNGGYSRLPARSPGTVRRSRFSSERFEPAAEPAMTMRFLAKA